jgi:hypothetical protein
MLRSEINEVARAPWNAGQPITLEALPPRFNRRWSVELQDQLLAALDQDVLTEAAACARYSLSHEDLASWRKARQGDVPPPSALAAQQTSLPTVDRLARLISVLQQRGLIDEFDVASLAMPADEAMNARLSSFMVFDSPIF